MALPGNSWLERVMGSESSGPLADPEKAFKPTGLLGAFGGRDGLLNFGLAMMANSGYGYGERKKSIGEIFGNSYLQAQQMAQQRASQKLMDEWRQTQIEQAQKPQQVQKRIVQGPDGKQYFEDGTPVLPNVTGAPKPRETRTIEVGSNQVTQEFDPQSGAWVDVAKAPRWQPATAKQDDSKARYYNTPNGLLRVGADGKEQIVEGTAPTGVSGRPMPMGLADDLKGNAQVISMIDEVMPKLKTPEGAKAVGGRNAVINMLTPDAISDNVKNYVDPKGTEVRALVTNLNSFVVKQRNGAAVTVSEFARQRGYLPSDSDNANAIQTKLTKLRAALEKENVFISDFAQSQGYRVPPVSNRAPGQTPGASGSWDEPQQGTPVVVDW